MTIDQMIRDRLATLDPLQIELRDESALHAGHAGAKGGGGHFRLRIVSAKFAAQPPIRRHRMVYDALGPLMRREIHAMSITALTPDESAVLSTSTPTQEPQ